MMDTSRDHIIKRLFHVGLADYAAGTERLVDRYRDGAAMAERGVAFFTPKRGMPVQEVTAMRLGHIDARKRGGGLLEETENDRP